MAGVTVDIGATTTRLNRGLKQSKNAIAQWAKRVATRIGRAGMNAGRAFVRGLTRTIRRGALVAGGLLAAGIGKSISEAGRFEAYEFQFAALMKSAEKAKERMQEIREVDLRVPFDITQLANASRMLEVFTAGAFSGADALTMMADAASVTPRPLEEIAYWYGRAYSMIKANRPLGEAVMRLTEMGLVSAEASLELQRLSKSYSPRAQARKMAIINAEFMKFEGSAALLTKTWKGVMSVFTSATKQAFEAVGNEIMPLAKVWLQEVIDKMAELRKDGTLAQWGQAVANWAGRARQEFDRLIPRILELRDKVRNYFDSLKETFETDSFAGVLRKASADGMEALVAGLRQHTPTLLAIGVELGSAIADGIINGMSKALNDHPIGKRVAFYLGAATGKPIRELHKEYRGMREARSQAFHGRQNLREMQVGFGQRLWAAMGGGPGGITDNAAIALAQRASANRDWAQQILRVSIVEDHTQSENIP